MIEHDIVFLPVLADGIYSDKIGIMTVPNIFVRDLIPPGSLQKIALYWAPLSVDSNGFLPEMKGHDI
jgi:hypothetical protein